MGLFDILFRRKTRSPADNTPRIVEKGAREPVDSFDVTLSGTDLENQDGSLRQTIIANSMPGTETIMIAQMGTLKLLAVFIAETGEQIGFVPREPSARLIREAKRHDYGSRIAEIGEPDPENGQRSVILTIDVYRKG